jgi:hypothetical protein
MLIECVVHGTDCLTCGVAVDLEVKQFELERDKLVQEIQKLHLKKMELLVLLESNHWVVLRKTFNEVEIQSHLDNYALCQTCKMIEEMKHPKEKRSTEH